MDKFEDIYAVVATEERQRLRHLKRLMLDAQIKATDLDLFIIAYVATGLFMIVLALFKSQYMHYAFVGCWLTLITGLVHHVHSLFRKEKNRVNAINCYCDYLKLLGRKYAKSY